MSKRRCGRLGQIKLGLTRNALFEIKQTKMSANQEKRAESRTTGTPLNKQESNEVRDKL
jgi:hypothetical protein